MPIEPPSGTCVKHEYGSCVPAQVYQLQAQKTRNVLGLPADYHLSPGLIMGKMHVRYMRRSRLSMEWPYLFGFIVNDPLLKKMKRSNLTGYSAYDVVIEREAGLNVLPTPHFNEILVTGKGGLAVTDPPIQPKLPCPVCHRNPTERVNYRSIALDESQWDGSDIFRFAHPFTGYIFVTHRWVDAIPENKFSGFKYRSTGGMMPGTKAIRR